MVRSMNLNRLAALAPAAVIAGTALGADLPSTKEPPLPPPEFSWHGPYAGVYAGALLGDGQFTFLTQTPIRREAFVGGGTLGYNWQWTPQIVLGLEADFGYRGPLEAERLFYVTPRAADGGVLGTARARIGHAFTPRWLVYGTGGFAYGTNFVPRSVFSIAPLAFGQQNTGPTLRAGWTAGAGAEYAWSDQISVKAEYLYAWLADSGINYTTTLGALPANVRSAGHIVRGGLNYHFSFGGPPVPPPPPPGPPPLVTK